MAGPVIATPLSPDAANGAFTAGHLSLLKRRELKRHQFERVLTDAKVAICSLRSRSVVDHGRLRASRQTRVDRSDQRCADSGPQWRRAGGGMLGRAEPRSICDRDCADPWFGIDHRSGPSLRFRHRRADRALQRRGRHGPFDGFAQGGAVVALRDATRRHAVGIGRRGPYLREATAILGRPPRPQAQCHGAVQSPRPMILRRTRR